MPAERVEEMIFCGEIRDAKTVAAVLNYRLSRERGGKGGNL